MGRWILLLVSLTFATVAHGDLESDRALSARLDRASSERETPHASIRFDQGAVPPAVMDEFAGLVESGIAEVAAFTKVAAPARVDVYVVREDVISHTYTRWPDGDGAPRIFLSAERVRSRSAPYLHELVHAVAGEGDAMWLEEGLASWVASEVTHRARGYYAEVLSGDNSRVDSQAAAILKNDSRDQIQRQFAWIRGDRVPRFSYDDERTSFYILAHSFTKYLAGRLGTRSLVGIHRANDIEELARRTSRTTSDWRRAWAEWLVPGIGRKLGD